jgi:DNA polymerase mu
LSTGTIAESAEICASERFRALREFATIYSIGTATAAELWSKGCRTLDDVRAHYCGDAGGEGEKPAERRAERKAAQRRLDGTMTRAEVVSAWLNLKPELDQK